MVYKTLVFSTKHQFLGKYNLFTFFTSSSKVSFKKKNIKLFKKIDKNFYLKLMKVFYVPPLCGCAWSLMAVRVCAPDGSQSLCS